MRKQTYKEELGISDFPTTVRLNQNTDERLLRRVAEVMRYGGMLAVYNEDKVIEALQKDGYEPSEARRFANDGCWEVQVPGKTFFMYLPFDSLHILQKNTLNGYEAGVDYPTFECLYQRYIADLKRAVEVLVQVRVENATHATKKGNGCGNRLLPAPSFLCLKEDVSKRVAPILKAGRFTISSLPTSVDLPTPSIACMPSKSWFTRNKG